MHDIIKASKACKDTLFEKNPIDKKNTNDTPSFVQENDDGVTLEKGIKNSCCSGKISNCIIC